MTAISGTAMVYAAGFGTRMGSLTKDTPKPLLKVGGRTLIDRALDVVAEGGLQGAVVNLHYRAGMIRDHLRERFSPVIAFSEEAGTILETGGGLKNALPLLGGTAIFTLNSDTFWQGPNAFTTLAQHWNPSQMDALLLLMPVARLHDSRRRGDFMIERDGRLRWPAAQETPPMIHTGAQIIKAAPFASWPKTVFSTVEVWTRLIAEKKCFGIVCEGAWIDVGRPEAIAEAEAMLRP